MIDALKSIELTDLFIQAVRVAGDRAGVPFAMMARAIYNQLKDIPPLSKNEQLSIASEYGIVPAREIVELGALARKLEKYP
jgi:hypothetical protein